MKRLLAIILLVVLLSVPAASLADWVRYRNCEIDVHADTVYMEFLSDYTQSSTVTMETGDWFAVRWKAEDPIAALYWEWNTMPKRALVECLNADGEVVSSEEYADIIRFLTVFPEADVTEVHMTVLEGTGKLAELFTYNENNIPPKAIAWELPAEKADILLVEAYGNSDVKVFGAVLPTYTDRGKTVQVVDIACDTIGRQRESLPGSYHSGMRNYKIFFQFKDLLTTTYSTIKKAWLEDDPRDPVELIVREIRRVRPEVVITHDIETGDFNHGGHKLTAELTVAAVEAASDPAQYPASAAEFGVWQVKKLYLHMAAENPITIDIDVPLESFGGKTAHEIAVEGMRLWHNGDDKRSIEAVRTRKYAPSDYGLVFSTVGEDVAKNDFLENIPIECLTDFVPTPTPEPTPTPTPAPTPTATAAPTATPEVTVSEPEPTPTVPWTPICIGAALIILGALTLKKRKR